MPKKVAVRENSKKKMFEERYSNEAIKEVIRDTITVPCASILKAVSRKEEPNGSYSDEAAQGLIKKILSTYLQDYSFMENSIYYDIKPIC